MAQAGSSSTIVCPGHARPVVEVDFSPETPDGVFMITACKDKKPMLRRGDTGDWIGSFLGHKGAVWSAKLSKEATLAATGSADYSAKIWDAITGDEVFTLNHPKVVRTVAFPSDAKRLATGSYDRNARIFDLNTPDKDPILLEHPDVVKKVLWTGNDKQLLTGCDDGYLRLWDIAKQNVVKEIKLTGPVTDLELNPSASILSVAAGKQAVFFDSSTFAFRAAHNYDREVETVSLHPTRGDRFVVGGGDDYLWVSLHDLETGQELRTNKGHHGPVHSVRFTPDGSRYASGSEDGTIRMWYFDGALAPRADDEDQGNVPDSLAEAFADMKVTKEEGKEEL